MDIYKHITIYIIYLTLTEGLECSQMAQKTRVQSQDESYQRIKKWYIIPPGLTLSTYKVGIKVKVEQSRERRSALPYNSV